MLIVPHGQRDLQILVRVQSAGIFEVPVAQSPGLAEDVDYFVLRRQQMHKGGVGCWPDAAETFHYQCTASLDIKGRRRSTEACGFKAISQPLGMLEAPVVRLTAG